MREDVLAIGMFAAKSVVPVAVWKPRFDRLQDHSPPVDRVGDPAEEP